MTSVSVIIVTYNGMQWLQECLDSLLKSTLKVSILVVDNCSTDGTVSFVKENYRQDVRLIALEKNLGFGKGNNVGISEALKKGADYVFLLNQDAFVQPETLEQLVKISKEYPDYGILSPIHTTDDGTALEATFQYFLGKGKGGQLVSDSVLGVSKRQIYEVPMVNAAAWLLPKMTIEKVGGFDPMFFLYGEDDNYCQRVLYHQFKIGIVPSVFIRHDSQSNNSKKVAVGSEKYFAQFLNRIKVKYGDVNYDAYKELGKVKLFFLQRVLISLMKLDLKTFRVNMTKWRLLKRLDLETKVLLNREEGIKYL